MWQVVRNVDPLAVGKRDGTAEKWMRTFEKRKKEGGAENGA